MLVLLHSLPLPMSSPVKDNTQPIPVTELPVKRKDGTAQTKDGVPKGAQNYKGFVAGVFSGIAKLSVGSGVPDHQLPIQMP